MASPQSLRSSNPQQSIVSQAYNDEAPRRPTYTELAYILEAALVDAAERYEHIPELLAALQEQYRDGIDACNSRERGAANLLLARLRGERLVIDAYNKHRLGKAAHRYFKATSPTEAEECLMELGEDIEEDLESFPLRCEVVIRGFDAFTLNLLPIYQKVNVKLLPTTSKKPIAKPTTDKESSTKKKTGRIIKNYDKLYGAPPPNLDFPVGNVTLAEMAAFHPEAIKSWDVLDRYCGNGGPQASFTAMINHFRKMERGPIPNNSVYRMMKGSMQRRAKVDDHYKNWTTGAHHQYHDAEHFDPASVSVTGFRAPADGKDQTTASPIPIANLASGVKTFPTGDDALDLTRAVRYCQDHPDEGWMYPTHYERLMNYLGGPAPVRPGHHDRAVIARYTSAQVAAGIRNAIGRKRDSHGRLLKQDSDEPHAVFTDYEEAGIDSDSDRLDVRVKKHTGLFDDSDDEGLRTPSRKGVSKGKKSARNLGSDYFDSESDGDDFHNSKKVKKVKLLRHSTRATKTTKCYDLDAVDAVDSGDEDFGNEA
jgi:hypothetical protein